MAGLLRWAKGLGLGAALVLAAGCAQATRTRCDPATAAGNCRPGETCVWTRSGGEAAYFCGITCNGGEACPSGQACATGVAASCQTCDDLVDLCE